jgi:1,4-alpha-glucan branching enzyme
MRLFAKQSGTLTINFIMEPRTTQSNAGTRSAAPVRRAGQRSNDSQRGTDNQPHTESQRSTNSQQSVDKQVEFSLRRPQATSVALAGSFNGWDPKRTPLRKNGEGIWGTTLKLAPGRYEYRFVADGEWLSDPTSGESVPNDFGSTNSVRVV